MSDKPANRILAALLSEQGRSMPDFTGVDWNSNHDHDAAAQTHVEATDHSEVHDLHRHDDDGGPGCPADRRAAQEEARKALLVPQGPDYYGTTAEWADSELEGNLSDMAGEAMPKAVSKSNRDIYKAAALAIGYGAVLPTGYDERKSIPIATGLLDYFPKACAAVAVVSRIGNDQHNPGEPLHWARGKSMDQDNTAIRHFLERGGFDTDGARHTAKAAWRMLARLELEIEADGLGLERKPA